MCDKSCSDTEECRYDKENCEYKCSAIEITTSTVSTLTLESELESIMESVLENVMETNLATNLASSTKTSNVSHFLMIFLLFFKIKLWKFARGCSPTQTPTQKLKSGFPVFSSQKIGSSSLSFSMIFKALKSKILRIKFYSPCSKILKIPEFTLIIMIDPVVQII